MLNIDEPSTGDLPHPLWRLAFRPGFLLAALFGLLAIGRWLYLLRYGGSANPFWWHGHEMIFGFALPVVAGFLLTAVATWTGLPGTRGWRLQLLFGLWLSARALLWLVPEAHWVAWLAETGFILLATWELGSRIAVRRQWRNAWFPPLLLALAAVNSLSYLWAGDAPRISALHQGAVWLITVFVVIVGGRVIPLFTGNRLGFKTEPNPTWLEYTAILSAIAVAVAAAMGASDGAAALFLLTGLLHLYRMWRWQGWRTLGVPLLWSMHLAYLCIPITLMTLGLVGSEHVAAKNLLHLLAVGAIGGMIQAMMSRVALGHTGRPLEVPAWLAAAFAMIFLSALVRALLPLALPGLTATAWNLSGTLWMLAFGLFLLRYTPILCAPRPDGKPG